MNGSPPEHPAYRFQGWELRTDERELRVRGRPVRLGRPAYLLLLALVRAQPRAVGKDSLMNAAWDDRVVQENNLTVQLTKLRQALDGVATIVNVPGYGYRLVATAEMDVAPPAPAPGTTPRAPAAPTLFGRDADLTEVLARIDASALVSIVGTGGVGKTALARAALEARRASWRDGAHWIDLAPLRDGVPLLQQVAKALAVLPDATGRVSDDFIELVSKRQALIVLDNCEHLLADVAAFIGPLLARGSALRWLVTSQERLHLDGESVYPLAPLQTPAPDSEPGAALASAALALFQARVCAADPAFVFTPDAVEQAAGLCRQLDGLPLAIEMAAARVATLGLQLVCGQIDQRLRLRTAIRGAPPRQSTLLDTFEWSYGLLSPVERCVFRRLEPFVGGFTPQMAQQLCCGIEDDGAGPLSSWEMLDALSALVEKSLVQRSAPGSLIAPDRRYLLESARDFARLKLAAAGETARVRRRHAEIVADAFALAGYELERLHDAHWAAKYAPERRNVGVALNWACAEREPGLLARLVTALAQLDAFAQADAEVLRYPVPVDVLHQAPPHERALAYLEFGSAHYLDHNREAGTELLERAVADFEALGDMAGLYAALTRLIRMVRGRPGMQSRAGAMWARLKQIGEREVPMRSRLRCLITVAPHFEGGRNIEQLWRLQRVAQSNGFDGQAASCQLQITDELLLTGRFEEAATAARGLLRTAGAGAGLRALSCHNLALALVRLGRFEEAYGVAQQLLHVMPGAAHIVLDLFAWIALHTGRPEDAALMAGRSAQLKRERDWSSEPVEAALIAETLHRLGEELGQAALAELSAMGGAMATPEVLALARPG